MANVKATDLIDFTRASKGHALAKVSYGSELVTNGTFNTDLSNWNNGNSKWTVSGSRAYHAPNSVFAVMRQSVPLTVGKIYRITFDYEVLQGQLRCQARDSSNQPNGNTLEIQDLTGTGSASVIFVPDSDYDSIGFARDDPGVTGEIYVDNVSIKEVTFDQPDGTLQLFEHPEGIPRIEYDADGNLLGLLIEEQRTNLVTYSDVDTTNWTGGAFANISTESVSNPFGFSSVVKVVPTTDTAGGAPKRTVQKSINVTTGTTYTYSAFVKAAGYNAAYIIFTDRPNVYGGVAYDLSTASLIELDGGNQGTLSNPFIEDFGDGWYRIGFSHDGDGGKDASNGVAVGFVPTGLTKTVNYGQSSFAGDGISGGYVAGVQVEAGSFPTSYIKTTGSTASRSADVASIDVADFGWNNKAGTVVAEVDTADASSFGILWSANADSFQNRTLAYINNDLIYMYNRKNNGVEVNDAFINAPLDSTPLKHGYAFTDGDFNHTLNGATVESVASNEMPVGINSFDIGNRLYTTGGHLNGHIKSIKYFPKRLSNAKLQELTS